MVKDKEIIENKSEELQDFTLDAKRTMLDIINDSPTIVKVGEREYAVKNLRMYSFNKICALATKMKMSDASIDEDNKILMALCTDLDAMCEIMAIILCNHLFTAKGENIEFGDFESHNDKLISIMKTKIMESEFDINEWANIILSAIKSCDLAGFFLLKKSVSMVTDSHLMRKKKSAEIASQFTEALSLQTQPTSSKPTHNTD